MKENNLKIPFNLQFFAGGGEASEGQAADEQEGTETSTETENGEEQEIEITPGMQARINAAIGKEKARLKAKYEKEKEEATKKAAKLATMSEQERREAEEQDRLTKLEQRERELELKEYRFEAARQLEQEGLSVDLVDTVMSDKPETTLNNIKAIKKQINILAEAEVKKRLAGKEPLTGTGQANISKGAQIAKEMNQTVKPTGDNPWKK